MHRIKRGLKIRSLSVVLTPFQRLPDAAFGRVVIVILNIGNGQVPVASALEILYKTARGHPGSISYSKTRFPSHHVTAHLYLSRAAIASKKRLVRLEVLPVPGYESPSDREIRHEDSHYRDKDPSSQPRRKRERTADPACDLKRREDKHHALPRSCRWFDHAAESEPILHCLDREQDRNRSADEK